MVVEKVDTQVAVDKKVKNKEQIFIYFFRASKLKNQH